MKRALVILAAINLVAATATVISFAQQPQPTTQSTVVMRERVMQGPEGGPPHPPSGDMLFMQSDFVSGKTVKNAPYSAQAVTESVQTLGDGNRIVNKMTSQLYRDSEGRTRREQTIKLLGPVSDAGDSFQTIFINDPVTGNSYVLDSKNHTAHKAMTFRFEKTMPGAEGQRFELRVQGGPDTGGVKVEGPPDGGVIVRTPGAAPVPGLPVPPPDSDHLFKIQAETAAGSTYVFRRSGPSENEVKEQLGKQIIEGVEAEGTRTTITIPAGEIGNEKAIDIVSERWYSPELQTVIMSKHSDPRSGETSYRLTNISRLEPAKTLFEVPGDYTVKSDMPGMPAIMPLPTRVRKQE
jgi:hypothetical protein